MLWGLFTHYEAFIELGGLTKIFYVSEMLIWEKASDLGMKVMFCPHSTIWHVGGASSGNNKNQTTSLV